MIELDICSYGYAFEQQRWWKGVKDGARDANGRGMNTKKVVYIKLEEK
jgi:hypothetical protein